MDSLGENEFCKTNVKEGAKRTNDSLSFLFGDDCAGQNLRKSTKKTIFRANGKWGPTAQWAEGWTLIKKNILLNYVFWVFSSIVNTPIKKNHSKKTLEAPQFLGMDLQSENFGEKVDFFRRQKGRL
jgi:hypothetical protein